jgi:hypothetical protein
MHTNSGTLAAPVLPEHAREPELPLRLREPELPRKRRTRCLSYLLTALMGGVLGAGGMLAWSLGSCPNPVLPPAPTCGACAVPLNGTFEGVGELKLIGLDITWRVTASYDAAAGSMSVHTHPLLNPLHDQPTVDCTGVPFRIDPNLCNISSDDACTRKNEGDLEYTVVRWDGADNITHVEHLNVPVLGKHVVVYTLQRMTS